MKSLLQEAATSVKELYELVVARRDIGEGVATLNSEPSTLNSEP
jgi:hypothetical protein